MKKKFDNIFYDDIFIYMVSSRKIDIFSKNNLKSKIRTLKISNVVDIISDVDLNIIAVITTETKIYLLNFDHQIINTFTLSGESFSRLYDKESKNLITSTLDLEKEESEIYIINFNNRTINYGVLQGLQMYSPYLVNNNDLVMIKNEVGDVHNTLVVVLNINSLALISTKPTNLKGGPFKMIDKLWCYDFTNAVYNFSDIKHISFNDLKMNYHFVNLIKKYNNKIYILNNNNTLVYNEHFELIDTVNNIDFENTIIDFHIEEEYEIILRNNKTEINIGINRVFHV